MVKACCHKIVGKWKLHLNKKIFKKQSKPPEFHYLYFFFAIWTNFNNILLVQIRGFYTVKGSKRVWVTYKTQIWFKWFNLILNIIEKKSTPDFVMIFIIIYETQIPFHKDIVLGRMLIDYNFHQRWRWLYYNFVLYIFLPTSLYIFEKKI